MGSLNRQFFVLLAGLALAGGVVRAQPAPAGEAKPSVLPVAFTVSGNALPYTGQVTVAMERAVRASERRQYVDPARTFDPTGYAELAENARKAADAMAFGRKEYDELEPGRGVESFNRAIHDYEQSPLWETFEDLVRATEMRILVRWGDDQTATKRELARLIGFAPNAEFPPELIPPELAREVEKARENLALETRFALDVRTEPVSARVYVNGEYKGTSPTTVRELPPGEHYLSLVAPGYDIIQRTVVVRAGATATDTLTPADRARPFFALIDRMKKNFRDPEETNAAQILLRAAKADELFVAGVTRADGMVRVEFHRIAGSDGHAIAVETLELPDTDREFARKVEEAAAQVLSTDRPRDAEGRPLGLRTGLQNIVKDISNVSDGAIRATVGIGAGVLIATGVTLGFLARSGEADLRALNQLDPRVDERASSARTLALSADIITGAGLVAAGTWAWLQFGQKARAQSDFTIDSPDAATPEKKKPEKKKDDGVWDPWAADETPGFWARPTIGWGSVGLQGGF